MKMDEDRARVAKVYPDHVADLRAEDIHAGLGLRDDRTRRAGRPWVMVNMVSSVDGRARVEGGAAGLGSPVDRTVMRTLRAQADAVMVGAGTLRAERLSLGLDDVDSAGQPVGVIVSSSATGWPRENLTSLGLQRVLVVTNDPDPGPSSQGVEFFSVPGTAAGAVDLRGAVVGLKKEKGLEVILAEGGPSLNASLFVHGLVDELFLTVAPKLVAFGTPSTIVATRGPEHLIENLRLVSQFVADDELFLRYAVGGTA